MVKFKVIFKYYILSIVVFSIIGILGFLWMNYLAFSSRIYPIDNTLNISSEKFPSLNKDSIAIADYKGNYLLLDFWFANCKFCLDDMSHYESLLANNENLSILSISIDKKDKVLNSISTPKSPWYFLNKRVNRWDIGFKEQNSNLLKKLDIVYYPTYILISPEGKILKKSQKGMYGFESYLKGTSNIKINSLCFSCIWPAIRVNFATLFIIFNILFFVVFGIIMGIKSSHQKC
jgi:thiol-disulfide isomerase/thioredoxin